MVRVSFHEELEMSESRLLEMGGKVRKQLEGVLEALYERNTDLADRIILEDDEIDGIYIEIEERIINLLALQAPVASDLRLVSAIIHSNLHIERMGDLCVNIAKFVQGGHPYPTDSPMVTRIGEMGVRASEMLDNTIQAFAQRSL